MTIVEGYSEHVMDARSPTSTRSSASCADGWSAAATERGLIEALLGRLLGLDVKMRQYRLGKEFCDEVAQRRGIETLNKVWSEPAALPRPSELEHVPGAGSRASPEQTR